LVDDLGESKGTVRGWEQAKIRHAPLCEKARGEAFLYIFPTRGHIDQLLDAEDLEEI
jgi:hypothetical protein